MPYLPIDTGFYQSSVKPIASQQLVNWYVDVPETTAITPTQLRQCPGLLEIADTGITEINRGSITVNGIPYFLNGTTFYKLQQTFGPLNAEILTMVSLGTIGGESMVSMATNGEQICIVVPNVSGWVYTIATNTLTQITDPAFLSLGPSVKVCYSDSFFIHTSADRRTAFNSAPNDALSYNGLDFIEAETDPDALIGNHSFADKLFLMGKTTTEVCQNVGALNFPFQVVYVIPIGIVAPLSVQNFDTTFAFVGQDVGGQPAIYQFDGNSFSKISHGAIDSTLQSYSPEDLANGIGFSYSQDGSVFYGVSFRQGTFVFESKSSRLLNKKLWHERKSFGLEAKNRWRVNSITQAYGRYFVGDSEGGKIGQMSIGIYQDYGQPQRRVFVAGPFKDASGPLFWKKIEIMCNSGQSNDSQIMMSYSDDGGYTWSYEQWSGMGEIGQYARQVTWNRLGRSLNSRMFKFEFSDNAKCVIIGLLGEFSGGRQ